MDYLYGDSAPSTLRSNFLEFLRDALDCCVFLLQSDTRIRHGREHMDLLRRDAEAETERLTVFVRSIKAAIEHAPKGQAATPTMQCAAQITSDCDGAERSFLDAIRQKLASDLAEAEAKEAAERAACTRALETLLVPHDPPDTLVVTQVVLEPSGSCAASCVGQTSFGLAWRFELAIPAGHPWSSQVRVERLVPQLEIRAPQLSGWISKEVKIKPQKLERHVITDLVDDGATMTFKLRVEPGAHAGFDVTVSPAQGAVSIERLAEEGAKDDSAVGAFDLEADDAAKLVDLATKLRASISGLERRSLSSATFDGAEFEALPTFTDVATRLVSMMTPITREISARSLTPTELVLRRLLGNDRREEIFVTKASLREKFASLDGMLRAVFTPLGLDVAREKKNEPLPKTPMPVMRSELPPSRPPPPPAAPMISIEPAPISGAFAVSGGPRTKDEVIVELKKNVSLIKSGSIDDGYRGFESFFSSDAFAGFRPEDQRQALKIMVLGKTPTPAVDSVVDAHLAAITCLQRLLETSNEPLDYEMNGVCHLVIEDVETAGKMFARGLELERDRSPQSELCGRLMKRVSAL